MYALPTFTKWLSGPSLMLLLPPIHTFLCCYNSVFTFSKIFIFVLLFSWSKKKLGGFLKLSYTFWTALVLWCPPFDANSSIWLPIFFSFFLRQRVQGEQCYFVGFTSAVWSCSALRLQLSGLPLSLRRCFQSSCSFNECISLFISCVCSCSCFYFICALSASAIMSSPDR